MTKYWDNEQIIDNDVFDKDISCIFDLVEKGPVVVLNESGEVCLRVALIKGEDDDE